MLAELGLDDTWRVLFAGSWVSLIACLCTGVVAWVSSRRNTDPSDLTVLFNADTDQFPRQYASLHRRPRAYRTVQHRRPVCRCKVPTGQRDTVQVRIIDPPEAGGRR